MAQNENLKMVLNLTEEWDKTQPENGSSLVTGVTVCRKEVLEQNPEEVETFLKEHKESADWVNTNVADAAELVLSKRPRWPRKQFRTAALSASMGRI